jgi:hypothetical protein
MHTMPPAVHSAARGLLAAFASAIASLTLAPGCAPAPAPGLVIQNPQGERPTFHDFGRIAAWEEVRHTFILRNNDPEPITIRRLMPACSCAVGRISYLDADGERVRGRPREEPVLTLPAGAEAELEVVVDPRHVRVKNADKLVVLRLSCDSPNTPFLTFELHLYVQSLLQATPQTIDLGPIPASSGGMGTSKVITGVAGSTVRVTGIESTSDSLEAELAHTVQSREHLWTVTARVAPGLPRGAFRGELRLALTGPGGPDDRRSFPIQVQATVVPDVILEPGTFSFGSFSPVDGALATAEVRALVGGDRVIVTGAAVSGADAQAISVAFEPVAADSLGRSERWSVSLHAHPSIQSATFSGRVELQLEHPLVSSIDAGYVGHTR